MPRHVSVSPSCARCRLRVPACVCGAAPHLMLATRVILVMHRIEWVKPSNTGHLAQLALQNVEIRFHGLPHVPVRCDDVNPETALAIFPGHGAIPLSADFLAGRPRPITLLVPDGNWNQSHRMMK